MFHLPPHSQPVPAPSGEDGPTHDGIVWATYPAERYPRHDACELWRFAWLASGIDPPFLPV